MFYGVVVYLLEITLGQPLQAIGFKLLLLHPAQECIEVERSVR
jgi:hypothetical protein